jgi:transposase
MAEPATRHDCDLIFINRQQSFLRTVDVEQLIPADHAARLFWDVTGQLDLSAFYADIRTQRGRAGRPTFDPRLLISVWLYAYQRGIGSAREIERLCQYDPGLQWLTALTPINHHSLSDFRVEHDEALKGLFQQVLGMLMLKRMITLERVTQDGTKILARVRNNSFRREGRIREHLEAARRHIEELGDPCASPNRQQSARRRAAKERAANLAAALEEIGKLQARRGGQTEEEKGPQASETDPEARFMRTRSHGVVPCYNVQITTDSAHGLMVDIETTNAENDARQLLPAMDRVQAATAQQPQQAIADGDYTNSENVKGMAERGIDFYGSWNTKTQKGAAFSRERFVWDSPTNQFVCPVGKGMPQVATQTIDQGTVQIYRVAKGECAPCPHRVECCGKDQKSDRSVSRRTDGAAVAAFKEKMAQEAAKAIYKTRSAIAEFPNLWIKAKFRLRQFWTQGLRKVGMEARWAGMAYNLQRYFRLEALGIEKV